MNDLNLFIDMFDGFRAAHSFNDRWVFADNFAKRLGASALNIAELNESSGEAAWLASSMSQDWMSHYIENAYYNADIVIDTGLKHYGVRAFNSQKTVDELASDIPYAIVNRDLLEFGIKGFVGGMEAATKQGNRIGTSLVYSENDFDTLSLDIIEKVSRFSSVVSTLIGTPEDTSRDDVFFLSRPSLTPREKDVLCLLANGHLYSRIAERLGIAEITVRTHVQSARNKLKASTREQAIAIAVRDGHISI